MSGVPQQRLLEEPFPIYLQIQAAAAAKKQHNEEKHSRAPVP